jgi:hypothetical protein
MKFPDWLTVYGDKDFRGKCPTETAEQITFFAELRRQFPIQGAVALHIRNEGIRTWQQAIRHCSEGMIKGAADIIIPGSPTFVCELKRKDHTKSSWQDGQLDYLRACQEAGCNVCVALGWEAAIGAVNLYQFINNNNS